MIWETRGGGGGGLLRSFLPFYVRDRAFSISRTRLSRSLEKAKRAADEESSLATAVRERRRHFSEDMDNLVYDISFFLFLLFPLNTCAQKALFNESLQRNLFNLKLRFEKK